MRQVDLKFKTGLQHTEECSNQKWKGARNLDLRSGGIYPTETADWKEGVHVGMYKMSASTSERRTRGKWACPAYQSGWVWQCTPITLRQIEAVLAWATPHMQANTTQRLVSILTSPCPPPFEVLLTHSSRTCPLYPHPPCPHPPRIGCCYTKEARMDLQAPRNEPRLPCSCCTPNTSILNAS